MKAATVVAVLGMAGASLASADAKATTIGCDGYSSAEVKEWAIMEAAQKGYTYDEVFAINQTDNFMKKFIVAVAAGGGDIPDQIPDGSTDYGTATVPVPPSKTHNDPGYDDRCLEALHAASRFAGHAIDVRELVVQIESMRASHECDADIMQKI